MWRKRIFSYFNRRNLVNLVALAIIIYLAVITMQVISKNFKLQQEVDSLNDEIEFLTLKNQELEYQIAYFGTDSFADKEARDKLGLRAPGEQVVILSNKVPSLVAGSDQIYEDGLSVQAALSNLEQWLYFLIKKEPS